MGAYGDVVRVYSCTAAPMGFENCILGVRVEYVLTRRKGRYQGGHPNVQGRAAGAYDGKEHAWL